MKVTLEYHTPDEDFEFRAGVDGAAMVRALQTLDEHLRDRLKYGDLPAEVSQEVKMIRTLLRESTPSWIWGG